MEAEVGNICVLQSLGQFMGEENITQLAVAVDVKDIHGRLAYSLSARAVEIHFAKIMTQGRHINHSTRTALLQTVLKQVGQQEMTGG